MRVNILCGSKNLAKAFKRYLVYVMDFEPEEIRLLLLGKADMISAQLLNAKLWIIEAFNPYEPDNPEGFRTAYKLAGGARFLLLFLSVPCGFPEQGPFWSTFSQLSLKEKVRTVLNSPPPSRDKFDKLILLWPQLACEPLHSHHHPISKKEVNHGKMADSDRK